MMAQGQRVAARPSVAVDMDEVLADVMPKFLDFYEKLTGLRPVREAYWGKKIYSLPGAADLREELFKPGFFADLPLIEGAKEGLDWLNTHLDVYIVTAAQEFPLSLNEKYHWLQTHFPQLSWRQYIFCGSKSIIGTDYMLDDHAFNLEHFKGIPLLFTANHNLNEQRFTRLNSWEEVVQWFEHELKELLI